MKSIGNSLAFWKSSPPEDQFATNLTSPSSSFSPTGAPNTNGGATNMASRPSTTPFGNNGRPSPAGFNNSGFGNNGFGGSTGTNSSNSGSFASHNSGGMRNPYNKSMPGANQNQSGFGATNQFTPTAPRTAQNFNMNRPSNPNSGFNSNGNMGTGSYGSGNTNGFKSSGTPGSLTNGLNSNNIPTNTPSQQFRDNTGGFQPDSSKFVPNPQGGTFAPKSTTPTNSSPANTTPNNNWNSYPNTNYPGFGSSSKMPASSPSSAGGFQSKNVQASADMTPPPSLPSTVFDKKGGYAPGSTGTSGKASQAGFDTNDSLYSPPTGSKIPSSSDGLYSPN